MADIEQQIAAQKDRLIAAYAQKAAAEAAIADARAVLAGLCFASGRLTPFEDRAVQDAGAGPGTAHTTG